MKARAGAAALWAGICAATLSGILPATAAERAPATRPAGLEEALEQTVTDGFPGVVAYVRQGERESRTAAGLADTASGERARLLHPAQQRELLTTVQFLDAPAYGLGVQRMEVPCGSDPGARLISVWETDGGGPGFTSVSLATTDGERQLVLAANVYDLGADLKGEPPVPRSKGLMKARMAALCD
ncbi:hypothetical protein [Streptomyces sp. YS-3]|uniref:hypothetical protein n=1 Tax=Streptomyces sp. YS-3 TaxID=3381352 RepID=UPI0038628E31